MHRLTTALVEGLRGGGVEVVNDTWFDTVTVRVPGGADRVVADARADGMNVRRVDADTVGVVARRDDDARVVRRVAASFGVRVEPGEGTDAIPGALVRTDAYLTHEVFHRYRSETEMLRYLRRLADKDLALDRTMIPLGSCTMKLNATTEMEPITWPEFGGIHPYAPARAGRGLPELIGDLERWLCEITGYDAVSLQPNAGSQGELAGLLAIRAYHRERGDERRDVCLIPASAHGTNAASAVMAGMRVKVVSDRRGRQHRRRRPQGPGRRARRHARRADGDLPVDPRRVRDLHHRGVRPDPRLRRPGVRRRRQPQRAGRARRARASSAPTSRT